MASSESGVNLIKKKVASLKTELDECQSRAAEAEDQLAEKETIIEKVWSYAIAFKCYKGFHCCNILISSLDDTGFDRMTDLICFKTVEYINLVHM